MATAVKDQNRISTLIAASSADGITIIRVNANPTNHGLMIDDDTTGTDHGRNVAVRDSNRVTVLMATSSADGTTPIEAYVTSDGKLLIDSM